MARYPEIAPYDHGMLDVGDGNRVYWETCGNPRGKPAVVLHGGPGSGAGAYFPRLFDPDAYRIVLLDQRGAGRSTPSAGAYGTDMSVNTTALSSPTWSRCGGTSGSSGGWCGACPGGRCWGCDTRRRIRTSCRSWC